MSAPILRREAMALPISVQAKDIDNFEKFLSKICLQLDVTCSWWRFHSTFPIQMYQHLRQHVL